MASAHCGNEITGACTLVGCGSGNETGLEITLIGDFPTDFTIHLIPQPLRDTISIECTALRPCDQVVFVPDFVPSLVLIGVEGEGVDYHAGLVPDYRVTLPNGPGCGECRHGTVTVAID